MPRKRYPTLDEAIQKLSEDDLGDDEPTDIDIVAIPPETAEASDDEEENDNILNHDGDNLSYDTAGEIEVHSKPKSEPSRNSYVHAKKFKKLKTDHLKWIKKEPLNMLQPRNEEKDRTVIVGNKVQDKTSGEIFDLFFDSDVISLLVEQTNLYARQKNRLDFMVSKACMRRFIGILILTGYHSLPEEQMYWSLDKDISIPIVRDSMPRSQYRNIKQNLHLADNNQIDKADKLYKIRPYLNLLNNKFQQFGIFSHNLSVNEHMIPYSGKHSAKMFLKGRLIRFGCKAWTLASSDGYVYNFDIYSGKSVGPESSEYEDLGLGGEAVLNLLKVIESPDNHAIYLDNFFTSFNLLCHLKNKGFSVTGAIQEKHINMCPLESVESVRKKERGHYDFQYEKEKKIIFVRWNDNSVVTLGSTFGKVTPVKNISRYSKIQKKKVLVPQPRLIAEYNAKMGGVDLCNNLVANYRIAIRGKKWWWPIFTNYIDVALVNAWKISRLSLSENKKSLLDFRREVALFLLHSPFESEKLGTCKSATGRPSKLSIPKLMQADHGHFIIKSEDKRRLRCKQCHSQTVYRCKICCVALHHDCSEAFHMQFLICM